jgi:hypothetical protein
MLEMPAFRGDAVERLSAKIHPSSFRFLEDIVTDTVSPDQIPVVLGRS